MIHWKSTCWSTVLCRVLYKKSLTGRRFVSHTVRGPYSTVCHDDIEHFKGILGEDNVLLQDLKSYNSDWLNSCHGDSKVVLRPRKVAHVSDILAHCHRRRLAVCPQSGNTGLVAGSTPVYDEIVLSMSLMDRVHHIDPLTGVLSCEAGCVLHTLDELASRHGLLVPLDLGAKQSCLIGGNLATNAGGLRVIRYGSLHSNVLGLRVVLADGEVIDLMSSMKKDATGYDLKHLFIGSEGTLGVITDVILQCPPRPASLQLVMLGVDSFESVLAIYQLVREYLAEILSSVEFMDKHSQDCLVSNLQLRHPLPGHSFYLLVETAGTCADHDCAKLDQFINHVLESGLAENGVRAENSAQRQTLWWCRERITEALAREGHNYKYDLSLPLPHFYSIVEVMRQRLCDNFITCCGYGHIGDGNIHLNITTRSFSPQTLSLIEPFVYSWTSERRGSMSAEHGVGYRKRQHLHLAKSASAISLMRSIKETFDPQSILNPYKVLPHPPVSSCYDLV